MKFAHVRMMRMLVLLAGVVFKIVESIDRNRPFRKRQSGRSRSGDVPLAEMLLSIFVLRSRVQSILESFEFRCRSSFVRTFGDEDHSRMLMVGKHSSWSLIGLTTRVSWTSFVGGRAS